MVIFLIFVLYNIEFVTSQFFKSCRFTRTMVRFEKFNPKRGAKSFFFYKKLI